VTMTVKFLSDNSLEMNRQFISSADPDCLHHTCILALSNGETVTVLSATSRRLRRFGQGGIYATKRQCQSLGQCSQVAGRPGDAPGEVNKRIGELQSQLEKQKLDLAEEALKAGTDGVPLPVKSASLRAEIEISKSRRWSCVDNMRSSCRNKHHKLMSIQ